MVLPDALPLIPYPAEVRRGEGTAPLAEVEETVDPTAGPAESYILDVDDRGIRITAADAAGLFYGTRTLNQLARQTDEGRVVPHVHIEDAPRFSYRGVMLDVARQFFSVADVQAYIDRASDLKLNHLHLHLTDDQGWRIQIDSWPLLTERGASSDSSGGDGGFYSKADYREIVAYAASRHMTVVPEVDLPGHTHAVGVAYPELVEPPVISEKTIAEASDLGQELPQHGAPYTGWGVGHSSVRIHEERTYAFIGDVLGELAELTPGPYLHIGGDECLGTSPADFATFIARVSRMAEETGKTPIAWHEAGAVADIAPGMIGQYWSTAVPEGDHAAHAAHFVERGGAVILSPSDRAYLDMKPSADFPLGLAWAGIVPLQQAYDWEPTAVIPDLPEKAILGVEAPLWSETVTTLADVLSLAFPRIGAQAEIAWSPQHGLERSWASFSARVAQRTSAWEASGTTLHDLEENA